MSSTKSEGAESSGGGKGIFIALIPWIVFTVLASHATLKLGSVAALATAIVIAGPQCARRASEAARARGGGDVHRVRGGGVPGGRFDGPLGRSVRARNRGVDPVGDLVRLVVVHAVYRGVRPRSGAGAVLGVAQVQGDQPQADDDVGVHLRGDGPVPRDRGRDRHQGGEHRVQLGHPVGIGVLGHQAVLRSGESDAAPVQPVV